MSQKVGSAWETCSVLKRSKRVTLFPPVCCNSRRLLLQITPLHFLLVQKQTPTPLQKLKALSLWSPEGKHILQTTFKKIKQLMWHRQLETKSHLCSLSNTPVKSLPPTNYTDHVTAIYFILWLPLPSAFDPGY